MNHVFKNKCPFLHRLKDCLKRRTETSIITTRVDLISSPEEGGRGPDALVQRPRRIATVQPRRGDARDKEIPRRDAPVQRVHLGGEERRIQALYLRIQTWFAKVLTKKVEDVAKMFV